VIVELRAVPGCPNLDAARHLLRSCLAAAGLPADGFIERIGEYPSPSIVVDGADVTGADPGAPASCVLRLPTAAEVLHALRPPST
jgi:hypothetical protein